MLYNVLQAVSAETGLDLVQKRAVLLALANRAAKTMYNILECNAIYREITIVVPPNMVASLPHYVGELRGIREFTGERPADIRSLLSPRYVSDSERWKRGIWRDKGTHPLHTTLSKVGPLFFSSVTAQNVTVKVSGQTSLAYRYEEDVLLNLTETSTGALFGPIIHSIACFSPRTQDIFVKDGDGNELAILYTTENCTRYKIVDISELCWNIDTQDGQTLVDLLYKVRCLEFKYDSEMFYAGDDYDTAWFNMCMFEYLKNQEARKQEAASFYSLGTKLMKDARENQDGGIVRKVTHEDNKYYRALRYSQYVE